jgi:Flp pilus assembly protein TadG
MIQQNKTSKRKGFIDQFLMFMLIFVMFVFMLFLLIGYSNTARIQHNLDTMASIVARMISTGKTTADIVSRINSFKLSYFAPITAADINTTCSGSSNKIVFTVSGVYDPPILSVFTIKSTSSAYNEQNSSDCTMTVNLLKQ